MAAKKNSAGSKRQPTAKTSFSWSMPKAPSTPANLPAPATSKLRIAATNATEFLAENDDIASRLEDGKITPDQAIASYRHLYGDKRLKNATEAVYVRDLDRLCLMLSQRRDAPRGRRAAGDTAQPDYMTAMKMGMNPSEFSQRKARAKLAESGLPAETPQRSTLANPAHRWRILMRHVRLLGKVGSKVWDSSTPAERAQLESDITIARGILDSVEESIPEQRPRRSMRSVAYAAA